MNEFEIMITVILTVNAVASLVLAFCLAHTWKYWRQVKWYVILMLVGNFLTILCNQGLTLGLMRAHWKRPETTASCRFYIFIYTLGPCVSAMATAALSLHVLLTSVTGSQGNRLRHALVLGLFVLLSLPLPLAKLSLMDVKEDRWNDRVYCTHALETWEEYLQLSIGEMLATVFFPAFLVICCIIVSAIIITRPAGTVKKDEDKSDLVLAGILGAILVVFYFPFAISELARAMFEASILHIVKGCFPFGSAVATVIFAYVHAYRNRANPAYTTGERQRLVN